MKPKFCESLITNEIFNTNYIFLLGTNLMQNIFDISNQQFSCLERFVLQNISNLFIHGINPITSPPLASLTHHLKLNYPKLSERGVDQDILFHTFNVQLLYSPSSCNHFRIL